MVEAKDLRGRTANDIAEVQRGGGGRKRRGFLVWEVLFGSVWKEMDLWFYGFQWFQYVLGSLLCSSCFNSDCFWSVKEFLKNWVVCRFALFHFVDLLAVFSTGLTHHFVACWFKVFLKCFSWLAGLIELTCTDSACALVHCISLFQLFSGCNLLGKVVLIFEFPFVQVMLVGN